MSNLTQYDYSSRIYSIDENVNDAIRFSIERYVGQELGWPHAQVEDRVKLEVTRSIPKAILKKLTDRGYDLRQKRVLDLGCGQGGMLHELLEQEVDAFGVEPGLEFITLAQLRLRAGGFATSKLIRSYAEFIPFGEGTFDFVLNLQVLEHVKDPEPILKEIYRVLKPGGVCYLSCENYLSFYEPHYRVRWFPMLPKVLGVLYLRLLRRNPNFLKRYIFYTTYPQIWRLARKTGFASEDTFTSKSHGLNTLVPSKKVQNSELSFFTKHLPKLFKRGVELYLRKPIVE